MTRLGYFLKFMATNFPTNEAQISGDSVGYLKNVIIEVINAVATFWATFVTNLILFIPSSGHTGK